MKFRKKIIKIITLTLIQSFLLLDFAWCGANNFLNHNRFVYRSTLAPHPTFGEDSIRKSFLWILQEASSSLKENLDRSAKFIKVETGTDLDPSEILTKRIDSLFRTVPELNLAIREYIIAQDDKVSQISFLPPNSNFIVRVIDDIEKLMNDPIKRNQLIKEFGEDNADKIVTLAALLSKIGFGHNKLNPKDKRTYFKNRIFAIKMLDNLKKKGLKEILGITDAQYDLFVEAILREGSFGYGTEPEEKFDDFKEIMAHDGINIILPGEPEKPDFINIIVRSKDKFKNPLTCLLSIASEINISKARLQEWQKYGTVIKALGEIASNLEIVDIYKEIKIAELTGEDAAGLNDELNKRLRKIIKEEIINSEKFEKRLKDEVKRKLRGKPPGEVKEEFTKIYEQIKANIGEVNSESYLWYISSYGIQDSFVTKNGEVIMMFALDWIPSLGMAGNLLHVREFHPQRIKKLLTQVNAAMKMDTKLIINRIRENEQLYQTIKHLFNGLLHEHLTMSVPFEITWNRVILEYDDGRAKVDRKYSKAYDEAVRKSEEFLQLLDEKRGLPKRQINLAKKFKNAREISKSLYEFITKYETNYGRKDNKDFYAEKVQALLDIVLLAKSLGISEQEDISAEEIKTLIAKLPAEKRMFAEGIEIVKMIDLIKNLSDKEKNNLQNKINLYFTLKYYVFDRMNFQEGALTLFVPHFMAVSKLQKISRQNSLITFKEMAKKGLHNYQLDQNAYVEGRFNIDAEDASAKTKNTLNELLAVLRGYKEFQVELKAKNPYIMPLILKIILSITKFDDASKPVADRKQHKNDSAQVIINIMEEALKLGNKPFDSVRDEKGNVILDLSGDRALQVTGMDVLEALVGMDAAGQEEFNPPYLFYEAYRKIHERNKQLLKEGRGSEVIGLTFHVGESLEDVTPQSAIRHVLEATFMQDFMPGTTHLKQIEESILERLGHAIILGVDFNQLLETEKSENIDERIRQINFDLWLLEQDLPLISVTEASLRRELENLNGYLTSEFYKKAIEISMLKEKGEFTPDDENRLSELENYIREHREKWRHINISEDGLEVITKYDPKQIRDLKTRAGFIRDELIERDVVVETNPTSNVGVSPYISDYSDHTLKIYLSYKYGGWAKDLIEELKENKEYQQELTKANDYLNHEQSKTNKDKKMKVTVSTDDLTLFGTSFTEELYRVAVAQGISVEEILDIVETGFDARMGRENRDLFNKKNIKEQISGMREVNKEENRVMQLLNEEDREIEAAEILDRYPGEPLLEFARLLVLEIITDPKGRRDIIKYHNERHFNELFEFSEPVLEALRALLPNPERAKVLIRLAIYFHDVGYFTKKDKAIAAGHEEESKRILRDLQHKLGLTNLEVEAICYMIDSTKFRLHGTEEDVGGVKKIVNLEQETQNNIRAYRLLKNFNIGKKLRIYDRRFLQTYLSNNFKITTAGFEELLFEAGRDTRNLIMGAIVGGHLLPVADLYAQGKEYPFLVGGGLQPEFKIDGIHAPTRFDQVRNTNFFLTKIATDMRLKYFLGIDSEGKKLPGYYNELSLDHWISEELRELRRENMALIQKIGNAIEGLRNGIDVDANGNNNVDILNGFILEGIEKGIFDKEIIAALTQEINDFKQEGLEVKRSLLRQALQKSLKQFLKQENLTEKDFKNIFDEQFPPTVINAMASEMIVRRYNSSEIVLREGNISPDDNAYMVLSGQANIYKKEGQGYRRIEDINTGEIIAKIDFLGGVVRDVSVSVTEGTILAQISQRMFRGLYFTNKLFADFVDGLIEQQREQLDLVAAYPTTGKSDTIMNIYLKDKQIKKEGSRPYRISSEAIDENVDKILKTLPKDISAKEIIIVSKGPLIQLLPDHKDGKKTVIVINHILFHSLSRENWNENLLAVLTNEIPNLRAEIEEDRDKDVELLRKGVAIAEELLRRWQAGKIIEINNDLEGLKDVADNIAKKEIEHLISINNNLIVENGLTEGMIEYLAENILKRRGKLFRQNLRNVIEEKLNFKVMPSIDLPIKNLVHRVTSQLVITDQDYDEIKRLILIPFIDIFRTENITQRMNEDTWKCFQSYKGMKVEFDLGKVKPHTLSLLIAADRVHQKANSLFVEKLIANGRISTLLKLAAETHNAYYRGEIDRMLKGADVLIAEFDWLNEDDVEEFLITGESAPGKSTMGEQFKNRRDEPNWKGKLSLEDVKEGKRIKFLEKIIRRQLENMEGERQLESDKRVYEQTLTEVQIKGMISKYKSILEELETMDEEAIISKFADLQLNTVAQPWDILMKEAGNYKGKKTDRALYLFGLQEAAVISNVMIMSVGEILGESKERNSLDNSALRLVNAFWRATNPWYDYFSKDGLTLISKAFDLKESKQTLGKDEVLKDEIVFKAILEAIKSDAAQSLIGKSVAERYPNAAMMWMDSQIKKTISELGINPNDINARAIRNLLGIKGIDYGIKKGLGTDGTHTIVLNPDAQIPEDKYGEAARLVVNKGYNLIDKTRLAEPYSVIDRYPPTIWYEGKNRQGWGWVDARKMIEAALKEVGLDITDENMAKIRSYLKVESTFYHGETEFTIVVESKGETVESVLREHEFLHIELEKSAKSQQQTLKQRIQAEDLVEQAI